MSHDLMTIPSSILNAAPHPTREAARAAGVNGWNLRCNHCGHWGALWYQGYRDGWGSLALCGPHATELRDELRRHRGVLKTLTKVNFEQPVQYAEEASHG